MIACQRSCGNNNMYRKYFITKTDFNLISKNRSQSLQLGFTSAAAGDTFLLHLDFIFAVNVKEESSEDDEDAEDSDRSHGVLEHDAGDACFYRGIFNTFLS